MSESSDPRLDVILEQLMELTAGNFHARVVPSDGNDSIDAIIAGLNMLGEEIAAADVEGKRQQEAINAERSQLLSLFDSIDEAIYVSDPPTFEVLFANKALVKLLGSDPCGKRCYKVLQNYEEPCSFCTNDVILANKGVPHRWEFHNSKIGADFLITDRIISWSDGRDVRFELAVDITELKVAEQRRRALEEQLLQAQKMEAIGNLAGGVAHDLNNLLAAILGLSFVLQADIDEESPLQQDVGAIVGACQQGRDMIRNLLGFARKGKYRRESVSLNKVARDVVSLLERTIPKMVTIRTELDPDLERVEGDPSQINHALMNLGINASDAMAGKGTLTFATDTILLQEGEMDGRHLGLEPGRYVRLRVKDTGIGMDQEVQRQVFEPFFTTKAQGTGLGLSMVYGTMKNHGGSLFLESEVDRGSTFTLLLPTLDEIPCKKETPNTSCVKGQGLVLVVDDEKYVRNGLRGMLVRLGFDVLLAQDGQEATALFDQHCDTLVLVLLDLLMPHMDGEETFEHLHQVKPEVPVLLSSGHSAEDVVSRLLEKGADGIIHKPYDMNELSHAIAGVFAASRS